MDQIYIYLFLAPIIIARAVGFYKLYEKAGVPGWKALIPIYRFYIMLKIIGRPNWWLIYYFIPIVNFFVAIGVFIDFLNSFGKTSLKDHALGILFSFVYLPVIAFDDKVKYLGTMDELPKLEKSKPREWVEAIVFAVVAATIIRSLIMEAFTIPTPSMEKSLLVGDFLFVSKFHYGSRTPATPLQMPLTHQKIWFTNIPSYLDWIQLEQRRLPGLGNVERNDVVVFNIPPMELNEGIDYPVDLKTNYIKRCVGIPGDVLKIEDKQVIVNGEPLENPVQMQFAYLVFSNSIISKRVMEKFDIPEMQLVSRDPVVQLMYLTDQQVEELKAETFITEIRPASNDPYRNFAPWEEGQLDQGIFPVDPERFQWNADWYGPITIPKEGMTIEINKETLATYGSTIELYEHHDDVIIAEDILRINGEEVSEYTFKQNYYFMMGDNRHNSLDSRYWGFVPEDHIVGKGFFIWLSLDQNASFLNKIRWNRFFKLIE